MGLSPWTITSQVFLNFPSSPFQVRLGEGQTPFPTWDRLWLNLPHWTASYCYGKCAMITPLLPFLNSGQELSLIRTLLDRVPGGKNITKLWNIPKTVALGVSHSHISSHSTYSSSSKWPFNYPYLFMALVPFHQVSSSQLWLPGFFCLSSFLIVICPETSVLWWIQDKLLIFSLFSFFLYD